MTRSKKEHLFLEAEERRRACTEWLKTLMIPGVPKPATKDELSLWARDHLGGSRSAFDAAWIWAIAVDDPIMFTQPWSAELSLVRSSDPVFETACHEANYSMTNILSGARVLEAAEKSEQRKQ